MRPASPSLGRRGYDIGALGAIYDFESSGVRFSVPGVAIELVSSENKSSIVGRFLARRGEGILMVSLEVDDLDEEVERLKAGGRRLVLEKNAIARAGKTNLVHPKSMHGVQFEVFEPAKESGT